MVALPTLLVDLQHGKAGGGAGQPRFEPPRGLFPAQAVLERIGPDAKAGPPIVTTGPITSAGLIGLRNDYAAIVISVTRPETAAQIILVDVTDPTRTSALELPGDASASIIAAELEP